MKSALPPQDMSLPISLDIYHKLLAASAAQGFQQEAWQIGAEAIHEWIVRNSPDALSLTTAAGYQWKNLFLPSGTLLRTVFAGKNYHCRVDGDGLYFNGCATSPSGFVNAVGGVRRNAWKVIWILLSGSQTWKRAESLRPAPRREMPRKDDWKQAR